MFAVQGVVETVSLWVTAFFGAFALLAVFVMVGAVFFELIDLWGFIFSIAYIVYFFAMVHKNEQREKALLSEGLG